MENDGDLEQHILVRSLPCLFQSSSKKSAADGDQKGAAGDHDQPESRWNSEVILGEMGPEKLIGRQVMRDRHDPAPSGKPVFRRIQQDDQDRH